MGLSILVITPTTGSPELVDAIKSVQNQTNKIVEHLLTGKKLALISDAGTPLISDPGFKLIGRLHELNIRIIPIPGPSSVIAALSVAGIPTDKFLFLGFLPNNIKTYDCNLIFQHFFCM